MAIDIDKLLDPERLTKSVLIKVLSALSLVGVSLGLYLVFMVVPNEQVMGAVQRIFYFHVASALAAYAVIFILLFASSFYLLTKKDAWDALAEAAATVSLLFCSVVLASGMIWGHSAWNTWWRWEPRLVSFLVLWLILFSYVVLRAFSEDHSRQRSFAAVLGIIAAVNVPIVIVSVKFLSQADQLHPEVVGKQGLKTASFVYALVTCIVAMVITGGLLTIIKTINLQLKNKILKLKRAYPHGNT
jgi:heme exporter protein C